MSSSLVGSSSSVVEVWREEGLRTDCSAGNVVESCDMLKKGSWCVPFSKA